MNGWIERGVFLAAIVGMTALLVNEGRTQVKLEGQVPITAKALYDQMAEGQAFQLIDLRPLEDDDNEDVGGFQYLRVPKSTPMPNCDLSQAPEAARPHIKPQLPTVIITADGDPAAIERCGVFKRARYLKGGVMAWSEAGLPEDEGEYTPPKPMGAGGGGCL